MRELTIEYLGDGTLNVCIAEGIKIRFAWWQVRIKYAPDGRVSECIVGPFFCDISGFAA